MSRYELTEISLSSNVDDHKSLYNPELKELALMELSKRLLDLHESVAQATEALERLKEAKETEDI